MLTDDEVIKEVMEAADKVLKTSGVRLICLALACKTESGHTIVTRFNPHFARCKCDACAQAILITKYKLLNAGKFGEPVKPN